jgi:multidrug efflux system membrane fusion protein
MSEPQAGQTPTGSPYYSAPPRRKRSFWRTFLWILLAIVVALVLVMLLTPHPAKGPGAGGGLGGRRPPTVVGVATAANGDMPVVLDALGTVTPEATVVVHTRIAGTLDKVNFREGQLVRGGDEIAEVDTRPYAVAEAQAEGQLLRDQAALDDAKLDLKRYQTLLAQDSVASQQVDTQAALVKQDQGIVRTDEANVAGAKLNLIYCHITAPVSGRIGLRAVDAGNYVQTGDTNGVATIARLDPIDVVFTLPEDNIPQVNARTASGATLTVTALDRAGVTTLATGELATLDNQVDTSTGTVKAKARFANAAGALFPSQFVNARLLVDTLHDVVIIPTSAVRHGPNGADFVYIVDDPTGDPSAKMAVVKLGPADGERTAVLSGLQAGDKVITEGGDRLRDGATVILPGQTPPGGFGAKPQNKGGFFGWLSGLFGKKPPPDQSQAAPAAGQAAGYGAGAQGGPASGYGAGGQAGGRGGRMQALIAQLDLDPDQQAKAKAIMTEMRQKAAATPGDPDAFRLAARDAGDKLKAILRPDQLAKFDELRTKMRGARGATGPGHGGGNG